MDIKVLELVKLIKDYFHWLDVEKKHPNAGFAKPRKEAEDLLREVIKDV